MSKLFHSGNLSGKFYDWSTVCPRCKKVCNAQHYRCTNCSATNCYIDAAPARMGRILRLGSAIAVTGGSASHTWLICNTCKAKQATIRCPSPECGLDLTGAVYSEYEYLNNIPLIYAGIMLAAMGALAIGLVGLFVAWGVWHQRDLDKQAKQAADAARNSGPAPVIIAKNYQGGRQFFQASELEAAGAGSYMRGIDLEGDVMIQGDLTHTVVRSTKAQIRLNGNATACMFILGSGSTFDGGDLSNTTLHIRGDGIARIRNLQMGSGVSVKQLTVENAADGQISSKELQVLGSLNPKVKVLKGAWK